MFEREVKVEIQVCSLTRLISFSSKIEVMEKVKEKHFKNIKNREAGRKATYYLM